MTELYNIQELIEEKRRKKRMLTVWLIMLSLFIMITVAVVVSFAVLPYGTSKSVFMLANVVLSVIFGGYTMFLFSMKYGRLRSYVKMLSYLHSGKVDTYSGWFLRFDKTLEVKEGVDYYTMILLEYNPHKNEYYERKVLIDMEKSVEFIPELRLVKYQTQGNVLLRYKLLNSTYKGTAGGMRLKMQSSGNK